MKKILIFLLAAGMGSMYSCNQSAKAPETNKELEKQLQEMFVNATENSVIELPEGTIQLSRPLVLDGVKGVTIRGKGMDKTILSFKGQKDGAEGLRITASGILLENFAIMDAKGDNIKIQDADGVTIRKVKSGWSKKHSTDNGSYGLYPVGCKNVLIEDCEVFGSADAGVYVGQSRGVTVRRNHVHDNVAGIEIENCVQAEVFDNLAEENTGGVLVFDMPDLPLRNGSDCKVYNNKIRNNNTKNFGVAGTAVAEIPAGSGFIVMATNNCEIYNNEITGHKTLSGGILSYLAFEKPYKDSLYDPYCGGIYIHNNKIEAGSGIPDLGTRFGRLLSLAYGGSIPDIVVDGFVNSAYKDASGKIKPEHRICIRNNGDISMSNADMPGNTKNRSSDPKQFDCSLNFTPIPAAPAAATAAP